MTAGFGRVHSAASSFTIGRGRVARAESGEGKDLSVAVDMPPELLETSRKVVEPGLTVASTDQAVFGAFSVASKQKPAVTALLRQFTGLG